jgi:hypothetical protein
MTSRPGANSASSRTSESRSSDAVRRLSAGFVHEVNNALNPLLAAIYLLEARAGDPAAVREIVVSLKGTAETDRKSVV